MEASVESIAVQSQAHSSLHKTEVAAGLFLYAFVGNYTCA